MWYSMWYSKKRWANRSGTHLKWSPHAEPVRYRSNRFRRFSSGPKRSESRHENGSRVFQKPIVNGLVKASRPWNLAGRSECPSVVRWGGGLYEVRTSLAQNRIARVLFYVDVKGRMVLLHGFIKKSRKTQQDDLKLAQQNMRKHARGLQ